MNRTQVQLNKDQACKDQACKDQACKDLAQFYETLD